VVELGRVVGVDESDVLARVLGAEVLDAGAVETHEDGKVPEVRGLAGVVEDELAPQAPGVVPPGECVRGQQSDQARRQERAPEEGGRRSESADGRILRERAFGHDPFAHRIFIPGSSRRW